MRSISRSSKKSASRRISLHLIVFAMLRPMSRMLWSLLLMLSIVAIADAQQWRAATARDWYSEQGWLVGSNYIPAPAINQLEMWQADTFDPQRIDLELGWAEGLGMNTMRV